MVQTEEVTLFLRVPGLLCDGYYGHREMNLKPDHTKSAMHGKVL